MSRTSISTSATWILGISLAGAIRSAGLWKDLWLDEVWSLQVASGMRSALDVFTLHHEINHYLNTLWLYWIGANAGNVQYHLLSFVCGVTAVAVAVVICRRRSVAAAWIAFVLFSFSYELVAYSTEARGYAAAVLCALVAFDAWERYTAKPRLLWASVYVVACMLGILSQPIFVAFLAAAIAASIYRRPPSAMLIHACPILALAALWSADMRIVEVGGGTKTESLVVAYRTALAWALGTVQNEFILTLSCIVAIVLLVLGLRRLPNDVRIFFLGAIIAFPLLLVIARRSAVVYTRHFMMATVFFLLLLSDLLATWWSDQRRLTCSLIIMVYLAINLWNIRQLARYGRGEYAAALHEIVDHTPDPYVTIGGNQDFRIGIEVRHYLPRTTGTRQGAYLNQGSWPDSGPYWIIVARESFESDGPPLEHFIDDRRNNYDFVRAYPSAPLSGLHWFIYRNRKR